MGIKIPIIAVTGNAMPEDVKEFLTAGVDDLLTKPVNSNQLQQCLVKWLHNIRI